MIGNEGNESSFFHSVSSPDYAEGSGFDSLKTRPSSPLFAVRDCVVERRIVPCLFDTGCNINLAARGFVGSLVREGGVSIVKAGSPLRIVLGDGQTQQTSSSVVRFTISNKEIGIENETVEAYVADIADKVPIILGTGFHVQAKLQWDLERNRLVSKRRSSEELNEVHETPWTPQKGLPAHLEALEPAEGDTGLQVLGFPEVKRLKKEKKIDGVFRVCYALIFDPDHYQEVSLRSIEGDRIVGEWASRYPTVLQPPEAAVQVSQKLRELGWTHEIPTGDAQPVAKAQYRLSPAEQAEVQKQLKQLLAAGLITEASSPWSSPILFVKKKSGELRMVVDYRALNLLTPTSRYGIPNIHANLDALGSAKVFSTIDLKSSYHQIYVKDEDQPKTAFTTRYGQFQFRAMPFGLKTAPATFQAIMNRIFLSMIDVFVVVYLDDLLVYSKTKEEHQVHLERVFEKLREFGLVANQAKCNLFREEVEYCGFRVGKKGIFTDPEKIRAVQQWKQPTNVTEVQSFLGLANFYRRFVKDFSRIANPLTQLTRKSNPFIFDDQCKISFVALKDALVSAPVLRPPDFAKAFHVWPDACQIAVGAVLTQLGVDGHQPIAFLSKKFNDAEKNYSTTEREILAIVHSLREWRCYLHGSEVVVHSDHRPLEYLRNHKNPGGRRVRWILELEAYDPKIEYVQGALQPGDGPSRNPVETVETTAISEADPLGLMSDAGQVHVLVGNRPVNLTQVRFQKDWPIFVADYLDDKPFPQHLTEDERRVIRTESKHFDISTGCLNRKVVADGEEKWVPFIMSHVRTQLIKRYHECLGHCGVATVMGILRVRYWWPCMQESVEQWIRECDVCQFAGRRGAAPLNPIRPIPPAPVPFECWGMDFVQDLPLTAGGNRHIVTAIDYCTRWFVAKAVPDRSTETVAKFLYEEILMKYGAPHEIISDRGSQFMAAVLEDYLKLQRVHHKATTPYHPRTNGMVERAHGILKPILTKLTEGIPEKWDKFLPEAVMTIRVRQHSVTKQSPFKMVFGIEPRLPFDSTPVRLFNLRDPTEAAKYRIYELEKMGLMRDAAFQRSLLQEKMMRERNGTNPRVGDFRPRFKIGERVKRKNHTATKFQFAWTGPYVVMQVTPAGAYKLQRPDGRLLKSLINQDDLDCFFGQTDRFSTATRGLVGRPDEADNELQAPDAVPEPPLLLFPDPDPPARDANQQIPVPRVPELPLVRPGT
jgi:transposase InsO family protein